MRADEVLRRVLVTISLVATAAAIFAWIIYGHPFITFQFPSTTYAWLAPVLWLLGFGVIAILGWLLIFVINKIANAIS